MDKPERRRVAACVVPLLFGTMSAARAAGRVRGVDFLTILGAGVLIGVGVMGLVRFFRDRPAATRPGS